MAKKPNRGLKLVVLKSPKKSKLGFKEEVLREFFSYINSNTADLLSKSFQEHISKNGMYLRLDGEC